MAPFKQKKKSKSSKAKNKTKSQAARDEMKAIEPEILQPESSTLPPHKSNSSSEAGTELDSDWKPNSVTEIPSESKALTPSDPVSRYLSEIGKYPLLTREEEQYWAQRYFEQGDPNAAEVLVTSNLRFVVKIATEYTKFGAKLIDLVQEGNVGLMHAVKEFNPYKGVKLITYAVWWIRGYIQEYLMRQYSMVRIGTTQAQRKLFYQLQKEKEMLEKIGPSEGIAQLSGRLGIPEGEVEKMHQRLTGRDVSLDHPVGDSENSSLMDFQTNESEIGVEEQLGNLEQIQHLKDQIENIKPSLNAREKFLLERRLLSDEPMTLQEIGDKYGITREAVRQLENRLMKKLRTQMLGDENS